MKKIVGFLWPFPNKYFLKAEVDWALHDVDLTIEHGQVLGVIGKNGSGKSTLLKLLCGVLSPTKGSIEVHGNLVALLELGAAFNPELTGRQNIRLSGLLMNLPVDEFLLYENQVIEFSGVEKFIDEPVKTYSSGMFTRLAFSAAIHSNPDILIIDEALSVGDGDFLRKSFQKIIEFKDSGKTIIFCSHVLYQITAICDKVLWLNEGKVQAYGPPAEVITNYNEYLDGLKQLDSGQQASDQCGRESTLISAQIKSIEVSVDGHVDKLFFIKTGQEDIQIKIQFDSNPEHFPPTVSVGFLAKDGRVIASACTLFDGILVHCDSSGRGGIVLTFPQLSLLPGNYWIAVYLLCERAIHVYDHVDFAAELRIEHDNLEQGIVSLPRIWNTKL